MGILTALLRRLFGRESTTRLNLNQPDTDASPTAPAATDPALTAPIWISERPAPLGLMGVAGESFHQPALRKLLKELRVLAGDLGLSRDEFNDFGRDFTATLMAEPENAHDSNAIAVLGPDGQVLGHLRRSVAAEYQKRLLITGPLPCAATLTGGTRDKPHIGVTLQWTVVHQQLKSVALPRAKPTGDKTQTP